MYIWLHYQGGFQAFRSVNCPHWAADVWEREYLCKQSIKRPIYQQGRGLFFFSNCVKQSCPTVDSALSGQEHNGTILLRNIVNPQYVAHSSHFNKHSLLVHMQRFVLIEDWCCESEGGKKKNPLWANKNFQVPNTPCYSVCQCGLEVCHFPFYFEGKRTSEWEENKKKR